VQTLGGSVIASRHYYTQKRKVLIRLHSSIHKALNVVITYVGLHKNYVTVYDG